MSNYQSRRKGSDLLWKAITSNEKLMELTSWTSSTHLGKPAGKSVRSISSWGTFGEPGRLCDLSHRAKQRHFLKVYQLDEWPSQTRGPWMGVIATHLHSTLCREKLQLRPRSYMSHVYVAVNTRRLTFSETDQRGVSARLLPSPASALDRSTAHESYWAQPCAEIPLSHSGIERMQRNSGRSSWSGSRKALTIRSRHDLDHFEGFYTRACALPCRPT